MLVWLNEPDDVSACIVAGSGAPHSGFHWRNSMMKRSLMAAGLLMALTAGGVAHDVKGGTAGAGHGHAHSLLEVAAAGAPRILELKVVEDAKSGFNLFLVTENFEFAPELASQQHAAGKGHGHVYVDGVKVSRLYGNAYHLEGLKPGEHRIEVVLNTNDHREYAVGGDKISAAATVVAP